MGIAKLGAVAVAGIAAGALAFGGSAAAHHNIPEASVSGDDCTITGTSMWAEPEGTHLVANTTLVVLVGGEVHHALIGEPLTVEDLPDGTTEAQWRIWGGGERDYDSPPLADLDALVTYLAADPANSPLDADAPGIDWYDIKVYGCPDPEPTPEPTTEPTVEPTVEPTEPAGEGGEDDPGELAQTGTRTTLLAGGAVGLLTLGGGLFWLARNRRVSFTA
jgi:hypothetical protein